MLRKFEREILESDWHQIRDGIEVKLCHPPVSEESEELDASQQETFILCRSRGRAEKDAAIVRRFEARIEERLKSMTEAEAAFRIHKSVLSIRPVWHQKEDRVLAHILVCFLAYVLWRTLGQLCQAAGLGNEPRRVLAELSDIRLLDVVLPTRSGIEIRRRCVSRPSDHQQILLQKLGLRLPSRIIQNQM